MHQEQALKKLKRNYNKTVVDHCLRPRNFRRLDRPDGYASNSGDDGDRIEIFVRMEKERIVECSFQTNGCAATLACGSMATELVKNKTYTEALSAASKDSIIDALEGLPQGNVHCADSVSETIKLVKT